MNLTCKYSPAIRVVAGLFGSLVLGATGVHAQSGLRAPGTAPRAAESAPAPPTNDPKRVQLVDRIVAIVNKEVITRNELEERVRVVLRQLQQSGVQPPAPEVLERQVLERMVTDRAQIQFANDGGIKIDDPALDRAVMRIADQNKMSMSDFRSALQRDGVSFDKLREDVRTEMLLARLREREVDAKIQLSESEIDNYLSDEKQNTNETAEFNLAHVLVRVPEGANSAAVERLQGRAREALGQLRGGVDFARVAVAFSDAPDGLQGGGMGWRTRDRLPELFAEAVESMRPGDTSEVLRSAAGFHILRLVDKRGARQESEQVESLRARHILVRTNEVVSEADARRKITQLRERIVEGAKFEEIARLNSDDASAARGGELGWLYTGDTVPEFERAMASLAPDEISGPVRTGFGFHLIQVLERRRGDVSTDRKRVEARKTLRERKADEAFEDWIRQLRDRTYVEYRLEDR